MRTSLLGVLLLWRGQNGENQRKNVNTENRPLCFFTVFQKALHRSAFLLYLIIFLKQIVRGALQNIADRLEIIKFDAVRFVIDDPVKVLIAQPQLDIKPILCFTLFFQYI